MDEFKCYTKKKLNGDYKWHFEITGDKKNGGREQLFLILENNVF